MLEITTEVRERDRERKGEQPIAHVSVSLITIDVLITMPCSTRVRSTTTVIECNSSATSIEMRFNCAPAVHSLGSSSTIIKSYRSFEFVQMMLTPSIRDLDSHV